jgi:hypothetical protein
MILPGGHCNRSPAQNLTETGRSCSNQQLVARASAAWGIHTTFVQADALVKAKELLVHKLPEKMQEYFPLLLEFQTSPEAIVKQQVVESVLECMEVVPRLDFLTAATGCVRHLLNDAFPSVVKAALVGAKNLSLVSLHALSYATPQQKEEAAAQWTALNGVIETISGALISHKNPGVRMLTLKLLEQVTLMTSASHCPGIKGGAPALVLQFRGWLSWGDTIAGVACRLVFLACPTL